jgi:hypothetical protein
MIFFSSKIEDQQVPKNIVVMHSLVFSLAALLTIITTAGYVTACNNLHRGVRYENKI